MPMEDARPHPSGMLKKMMDRLMNVIVRFRLISLLLFVLFFRCSLHAQSEAERRNWDFGVWAAGETGEENTNSFAEAQILTAGVFVGKELTDEVGKGWRRGRFEYGISVFPLFRQFRAESIYGGGFEPVILRWNSSLHTSHLRPTSNWLEAPYAPTPTSPLEIPRISISPRAAAAEFSSLPNAGNLSISAADGRTSRTRIWVSGILSSTEFR